MDTPTVSGPSVPTTPTTAVAPVDGFKKYYRQAENRYAPNSRYYYVILHYIISHSKHEPNKSEFVPLHVPIQMR